MKKTWCRRCCGGRFGSTAHPSCWWRSASASRAQAPGTSRSRSYRNLPSSGASLRATGKTIRLPERSGGGPIPFEYLPGQFLTLHVAPRGIPTKRSYTIASSPTWRDHIEITVKREGQGLVSRWLHDELRIGDEVEIEAPNGTFVFSGKEADRVVLIGGGVGITPLMSVVRNLAATGWPGKIHLILSFRSPRDFIFRKELT